MVERRLGRGLDFFLSSAGAGSGGPASEVQLLEIQSILRNPNQPRLEFSEQELQELASSIRVHGVLQPILVRKKGSSHELVAGERRLRAAQMAGLERIPALVREFSGEASAVAALVENIQRTDLSAIEKAKAFRKLLEMTKGTQEQLAQQIGLDRSTVANLIRLLELPAEVQAAVSRGTLTMGHARALLGLRNGEEQQRVAEEVLRKKLSVRQLEALVASLNAAAPTAPRPVDGPPPKPAKGRPAWVSEIEETLAEALGASVRVRYGRNRSTIQIECGERADFERVYDLLKSLAT